MSDQPKALNLFDTAGWKRIAEVLEAERNEIRLREFYRNLTEFDKRWLQGLKIGWSAQKTLESQPGQK